MNPSNAAKFSFPSLPDNSVLSLAAADAFSRPDNGSSAPGCSLIGGIVTFPPSESAHALAARAPKL